MDRALTQQLQDIIAQGRSIAVATTRNPKTDEMAASLSLYLSLSSMNKTVSIVSPTDPIVELSSLVGIDKVKKSIESDSGDLVVSFPYKDGEIEKVSYTIDENRLNIVVKASAEGLSFTPKDVQFKRSGSSVDVLIVVGTPRLSDLGEIYNGETMKDTKIINIDNHEANQQFGDLVMLNTNASSVSEVVAEIVSTLTPDMDVDIAQNLLSGISFATNNFQSSTTSFTAFEMAALLMKKGAIRQAVRNEERPQRFAPRQENTRQQLDRNVSTMSPSEDRQAPQATFNQSPRFQQPRGGQNQPRRQPQQNFNQNNQINAGQPMQQPTMQNSQPNVSPMPQQRQPMQSINQSQPMQTQQPEFNQPVQNSAPTMSQTQEPEFEEAPSDWLTPKVYKGSSNV